MLPPAGGSNRDPVRAHVDDANAGAFDLLPGEEADLRFRVPPAYGEIDYEFRQGKYPPTDCLVNP